MSKLSDILSNAESGFGSSMGTGNRNDAASGDLTSLSKSLSIGFSKIISSNGNNPYISKNLEAVDAGSISTAVEGLSRNIKLVDTKVRMLDKNITINTKLLEYNKKVIDQTNQLLQRQLAAQNYNRYKSDENKFENAALSDLIDKRLQDQLAKMGLSRSGPFNGSGGGADIGGAIGGLLGNVIRGGEAVAGAAGGGVAAEAAGAGALDWIVGAGAAVLAPEVMIPAAVAIGAAAWLYNDSTRVRTPEEQGAGYWGEPGNNKSQGHNAPASHSYSSSKYIYNGRAGPPAPPASHAPVTPTAPDSMSVFGSFAERAKLQKSLDELIKSKKADHATRMSQEYSDKFNESPEQKYYNGEAPLQTHEDLLRRILSPEEQYNAGLAPMKIYQKSGGSASYVDGNSDSGVGTGPKGPTSRYVRKPAQSASDKKLHDAYQQYDSTRSSNYYDEQIKAMKAKINKLRKPGGSSSLTSPYGPAGTRFDTASIDPNISGLFDGPSNGLQQPTSQHDLNLQEQSNSVKVEKKIADLTSEFVKYNLKVEELNLKADRVKFDISDFIEIKSNSEIRLISNQRISLISPIIELIGKQTTADYVATTSTGSYGGGDSRGGDVRPLSGPNSSGSPDDRANNSSKTGSGGAGSVPMSGNVNDRKNAAMRYFKSQGWTDAQAAGIVANLVSESGLDPGVKGDGGAAFGIGQWHPDRQANFKKVFGHTIQDSTYEEQLAFVQWELKNTHKAAGNALGKAQTAYDATSAVMKKFEVPADQSDRAVSGRNSVATGILKNPDSYAPLKPGDADPTDTASSSSSQQAGPSSGGSATGGGATTNTGNNGKLDDSSLVPIGGGHRLSGTAAAQYEEMVKAAKADGIDWTVTDSYRDYNSQVKLAQQKGLYSQGGLAATPGHSNHGWGTAVDLGGGANKSGSKQNDWLVKNAARFGFHTIPREPWHWEYRGAGGVTGGATNAASAGAPASAKGIRPSAPGKQADDGKVTGTAPGLQPPDTKDDGRPIAPKPITKIASDAADIRPTPGARGPSSRGKKVTVLPGKHESQPNTHDGVNMTAHPLPSYTDSVIV